MAYAVTTGGVLWVSTPQPLVTGIPPTSSLEQVGHGLMTLRDAADFPPVHGGLVWLNAEEPYLPEP